MKHVLIIIIAIAGSIMLWNITAYRDIELLKNKSPEFLKQNGFKVVAYDGYEGGIFSGGYTWYHCRDSAGYLYNMATGEWRGELMIYNNKCLNAVQNND